MYQGYPITHQILCLSTLSELAVSCQQAYCVFWDTHWWLDSRFETSLLGAACVLLIIMAIRLVWAWLPHQCLILSQCLSSQVWDVLNATALKTWFCTRSSLKSAPLLYSLSWCCTLWQYKRVHPDQTLISMRRLPPLGAWGNSEPTIVNTEEGVVGLGIQMNNGIRGEFIDPKCTTISKV